VAAFARRLTLAAWSATMALTFSPARAESGEESGLKLGRLRLHPRFTLSYSFDSNVFMRESGEGQGPQAGNRLNIAPGLSLTSAPEAPIDFSFGAGVEYLLFLSDDPNIKNQSDAGVVSDLNVTFNPRGDVSFSILNNFRRQVNAPTQELPRPFNRDLEKAGLKLAIQPGGRALTFDLFYYFSLEHFENYGFGSVNAQSFDNTAHEILFRTRWKFLPKTALIGEVQGQFYRWDSAAFNNSNPFRVYLGIVGNVTAKLSLTARLGYGHSFHANGPSFNSAIGSVELAYQFAEAGTARLQYARDFIPGTWGNYFDNHRVEAATEITLWRRLTLRGGMGYMRLGFAANPDATLLGGAGATLTSADTRADNLVTLSAGGTVPVKRWLSFLASYALEYRTSNNAVLYPTLARPAEGFGYARHLVTVGMGASY
jgi:hypothetical protein